MVAQNNISSKTIDTLLKISSDIDIQSKNCNAGHFGKSIFARCEERIRDDFDSVHRSMKSSNGRIHVSLLCNRYKDCMQRDKRAYEPIELEMFLKKIMTRHYPLDTDAVEEEYGSATKVEFERINNGITPQGKRQIYRQSIHHVNDALDNYSAVIDSISAGIKEIDKLIAEEKLSDIKITSASHIQINNIRRLERIIYLLEGVRDLNLLDDSSDENAYDGILVSHLAYILILSQMVDNAVFDVVELRTEKIHYSQHVPIYSKEYYTKKERAVMWIKDFIKRW